MEITAKRVAIAVGGAGAVAVAARFGFGIRTAVSQGGSPWGGPINWFLARKGPIGFGVKEALRGNLHESLVIKEAEEVVRTMENRVFYDGAKQVGKKLLIGYDNGPDAFRHTGGSALIAYRLMQDAKLAAPDKAAALERLATRVHDMQSAADVHAIFGLKVDPTGPKPVRELERRVEMFVRAQRSHEGDSYLHTYDLLHWKNSGDMDFYNNAVGATTGIEQATAHARMGVDELARLADAEVSKLPQPMQDALRALDPGEQLVLKRVIDGIEEGRSVSMTPLPGVQYRDALHPAAPKGIHQQPHPASFDDIFVRDAAGQRQVRTMAPHAAGYPQPFRDGEYHGDMERVPMNVRSLFAKRPKLSQ